MKTAFSSIGYMPHLDGVRAVAVFLVILEHWSSGLPRAIKDIIKTLDLSLWGVECFFVLSGFLITLILLKDKETSASVPTALGHFYTRRVLRIFPAYYITLIAILIFADDSANSVTLHALYLSNLYGSWTNEWLRPGGHFWSLAVEEQFYLFWPLVVLTVSTQKLRRIAVILCAVAPISRLFIFSLSGEHQLASFMFPTTALDLLCFGAFLACVKHQTSALDFARYSRMLVLAGVAALILYLYVLFTARDSLLFIVFGRALSAVFFGAFVVSAANGFSGVSSRVLGNPLTVWLGMVSYGLYIFHPFVPKMYVALGKYLNFDMSVWGTYYIRYPLMFFILFAITALSFYLIERPIRGYKKRFT